jgi:hypothetical protein
LEDVEEQHEPYQVTHYYHEQLEQFEQDYARWEETQYLRCHQHFEETMLEMYERAILLMQHQQQERLPVADPNIFNDDDGNNGYNNNIIFNVNHDDDDRYPPLVNCQVIHQGEVEENVEVLDKDNGNSNEHCLSSKNIKMPITYPWVMKERGKR